MCLTFVWLAPWVVVAATGQTQQRADDLPPLSARLPAGGAVRPNVLIIGIDGIDAQALSAYGYERATTPFLESLSEQSLFFENAFSNADGTHGSLVTLLTGRLPFETRVTFPPTALQGEDARRNLAMILKERGYATVQLGMRHYADANDMNLTGFDAVNYRWRFAEGLPSGRRWPTRHASFRAQVADRLDQRLGRLLGLEQTADAFAEVQGRKEVPAWRDERRVGHAGGALSARRRALVRAPPPSRYPLLRGAPTAAALCVGPPGTRPPRQSNSGRPTGSYAGCSPACRMPGCSNERSWS